jgi:hypothetical protein
MISGGAWRVPAYWPGGVRHGGDVSLVCCFCAEREKASADTAVLVGRREGASQSAETVRD